MICSMKAFVFWGVGPGEGRSKRCQSRRWIDLVDTQARVDVRWSVATVFAVLGDNGKVFLYPVFCHRAADYPRAQEQGKIVLSERLLFHQMLGGLVEGIWEQKLPISRLLVTVLPTGKYQRKGSGRFQSKRHRDRNQRSHKTDGIAKGPTPNMAPHPNSLISEPAALKSSLLVWESPCGKANQGHPSLLSMPLGECRQPGGCRSPSGILQYTQI